MNQPYSNSLIHDDIIDNKSTDIIESSIIKIDNFKKTKNNNEEYISLLNDLENILKVSLLKLTSAGKY